MEKVNKDREEAKKEHDMIMEMHARQKLEEACRDYRAERYNCGRRNRGETFEEYMRGGKF